MVDRLGAFLDGVNLLLRPGTNGKVLMEATSFFEQLNLKSHANYAGSHWQVKTKSLTTTDNTATPIISIDVAESQALAIVSFVFGWQSDWTDATIALHIAAATRVAAGNVTEKGTESLTIVESNASTAVDGAADTTDQEYDIRVTGITAETYHWTSLHFYCIGTSAS